MLPTISASRSVLASLSRRWWLLVGLAVMATPPVEAVQRQTAWVATVPYVYSFQYLLYLPPGYDPQAAATWPLLVFLHGSGQSGTNLEMVAVSGPTREIEQGRDFPGVVISPQSTSAMWWNTAALEPFIQDMILRYHIDPNRVYVTGLSMGGYGTWDLAVRHPERYAAVVPLCGGGDPSQAYKLRDLEVWAFHGKLDPTVPVARTQEMIDAIRLAGGNPRVTIYPDLGHDVWTVTYANDTLYDWLFEQSRENTAAPPPTPPTASIVPATPAATAPSTPVASTGGSSGGGGAISDWSLAALVLLALIRRVRAPSGG